MNRRGFFGRLLGAVATLVGVKAVEAAAKKSRETMIRPPWMDHWLELSSCGIPLLRRQGRLQFDTTGRFALHQQPILQIPVGWRITASHYRLVDGRDMIDFDQTMRPAFGLPALPFWPQAEV